MFIYPKVTREKYTTQYISPSVLICFLLEALKTNLEPNNDPSSHKAIAWICNELSVAAPHVRECRQEGWSSQLLLFKRCSGKRAHSLPGKQRSGRWCVLACDPTLVKSVASLLQPPNKLSMLLPVQWTALRRFVWTVSATARSSAALRLSAVGSPPSALQVQRDSRGSGSWPGSPAHMEGDVMDKVEATATVCDFDPISGCIPATKVEITVSCR